MSANPQPISTQKTAANPGPADAYSRSRRAGYFEHQHDWCEQIAWIAQKSAVQMYLIPKLLSLRNQRAAKLAAEDRPQTGCTGLFEIRSLAWPDDPDKLPRDVTTVTHWEARNFQLALHDLAERGVIEKYTRDEAIAAGLVTKAEAGRLRDAYVVRPLVERWKEIAADLAAAAAGELRAEAEDEPEETDPAEPEIVHVTNEPLILMPGQKARPLTLSDAVHKRWSRCKTVEFECGLNLPVAQEFTICGDVIRLSLHAHQQTKGESETKCISLGAPTPAKPEKRRKGETQTKCISLETPDAEKRRKGEGQTKCNSLGNVAELADYVTPMSLKYCRVALDPDTLTAMNAALDGCPIAPSGEFDERPCYSSVLLATLNDLQKKRKEIVTGIFLWAAKKAGESWKAWQAYCPEPQPETPAPMTRAQRAAALAITMQDLAEMPNHIQAAEWRQHLEATQANDPELYREAEQQAAQNR